MQIYVSEWLCLSLLLLSLLSYINFNFTEYLRNELCDVMDSHLKKLIDIFGSYLNFVSK
jgi:hypothetical protein